MFVTGCTRIGLYRYIDIFVGYHGDMWGVGQSITEQLEFLASNICILTDIKCDISRLSEICLSLAVPELNCRYFRLPLDIYRVDALIVVHLPLQRFLVL